ncbi:MAG: iron chelate uptake ABC transporter family permease subunit, partial [Firmicutes bacterium]|nr:iron chelate uptake ABC transporter family permease subunit [Bacillota bacterium]
MTSPVSSEPAGQAAGAGPAVPAKLAAGVLRQGRRRGRRAGPLALMLGLAAAAGGAIIAGTAVGVVPLPYGETARIVVSKLLSLGLPADPAHEAIIWSVRLPRVLSAGRAGFVLGVCGAAMQALFK